MRYLIDALYFTSKFGGGGWNEINAEDEESAIQVIVNEKASHGWEVDKIVRADKGPHEPIHNERCLIIKEIVPMPEKSYWVGNEKRSE